MSTHQDLPPALLAELEHLKALPRDSEGPIADTYERLHGVSFVRAAAPSREITDPSARVYLALMQCRELFCFNMASLLRNCAGEFAARKGNPLDAASHHLRWLYTIARLNYDISTSAAALSDAASGLGGGSQPSSAHGELNMALQAFDDASMAYLSEHERVIGDAIERNYLLDGASVFAHTTKNLLQLLETSFALPLVPVGEALLNSHILRAGVHSVNTRSPSYMMQFRLLHQIPEVLAFELAGLLTSAVERVRDRSFGKATADLRLANICLNHIVSALHPLIELMYPSEYYKFRAHLGQTSGSHSNDLAKTVLRQAYHSLAEAFVSLRLPAAPEHGSLEKSLSDEVNQVRQHISKWRAVHIALPRNVLGTEATSLIGSRNAEQIVQDMKASFEARDALGRDRTKSSKNDSGERAADLPAVDHKLRVMTGTVTKRKFPDVEKREGTFSPKR
jgi:tryptophan 2,3-dioxygenase